MGADSTTSRRALTGVSFKEVLVLLAFVETENEPMPAAGIEKALERKKIRVLLPTGGATARISRRWASTMCTQLVSDGILTYEKRKIPRQRDLVKFYKLVENLDMLRELKRRMMTFFGRRIIGKGFIREILRKNLAKDFEDYYGISLTAQAEKDILTLVTASTRAFELALVRPQLPPCEAGTTKERTENITKDIVLALLVAFAYDIFEKGLGWRSKLLERIVLDVNASFKIGKAEATIESSFAYVSHEKPEILDMLKAGSS